jgi:hypothetical protein
VESNKGLEEQIKLSDNNLIWLKDILRKLAPTSTSYLYFYGRLKAEELLNKQLRDRKGGNNDSV